MVVYENRTALAWLEEIVVAASLVCQVSGNVTRIEIIVVTQEAHG